jgi:uncharacterized NAD(P)/FAD-binding protein YdhS
MEAPMGTPGPASFEKPPCSLAIVGGGASGALLALHALRQGRTGQEVAIIEASAGPLGSGVAYRTEDPLHMLNVAADRMSALPSEPDSFVRWLSKSSPGTLEGSSGYVPRALYGRYLAELLEDEASRSPARLRRIQDDAVGIEAGRIRLARGAPIEADRVALALGPFEASEPPAAFASLVNGAEYFGQVWGKSGVVELPSRDGRVLILGTGLTMVDVAQTLVSRGHRGKITALSRRGLLPRSQRVPRTTPVLPAFAPGDALSKVARELIRAVRAKAQAKEDWRADVDGLRELTPALWAAFSTAEKRRFLRHLRPFWDVHRHRMPPESASRMAEIVSWRKVDVLAGRALSAKRLRRAVQVEIYDRELGSRAKLDVDVVLNCMGPVSDFAIASPPLVRELLDRGLARADATGLGLETDPDGRVLDASGSPSVWLFALGALRRGTLWESTAIPEIRAQAERLAKLVAAVPG